MDIQDLQKYIDSSISPARPLGILVREIQDDHILFAPLHLNKNDKGTAFAGSLTKSVQQQSSMLRL
jgi:hypothetical protein